MASCDSEYHFLPDHAIALAYMHFLSCIFVTIKSDGCIKKYIESEKKRKKYRKYIKNVQRIKKKKNE